MDPLPKDLRVLTSHHTKPRYSCGMGRGGLKTDERPWQHQGGGYRSGQGGGKWSLWHGAYKSSPKGGRPEKPQQMGFPAYDAAWKKSGEVMEVVTVSSSSASGRGLVRDVQSAVNAARRLEQKLARTQKEMLQKGQAWDSWVLQMRTSYQKEFERHQSEQRRLAQEIRDLEDQTQTAYAQVQLCATHQPALTKAEAPPPLAWEKNMEVEEELTEAQTRAELQRILRTPPPPGLSTPPRAPGTAPRTPTRIPDGLAPMEVGIPASGPEDPYPSPGPDGGSEVPGQAGSQGPRDPRHPAVARERLVGQTTLAEKLSDKRRAYRSAMAPFGVCRGADGADFPPKAEDRNVRTTTAVGQVLLDDDGDGLLAAQSPGFGNLE